MRKHAVLAAVALATSATVASAQASACSGGGPVGQITQDGCQKAVDLFQYMAPQLGGAITGGNATIGQGGALGGIGHISVGVRANVVAGSLPRVDDASARPVFTGARPTDYRTSNQLVPMATADAAIGLFGGIPLGLTNVGGVDLLLSATYIPKGNFDAVSVEPDNPLKIGYGVRVGVLQESLVSPGIAITYLKRDLPKLALTATASGSDTLRVNGVDEKTSAWRIVASKSLIVFGVAAGFGQDKYESSASANATSSGLTSGSISIVQSMTRTNMFVDLSLNLPVFKLVGEVGQVSGGDAPATLNTFQGKSVNDSRLYGSLGVRLGW